MSRAALLLLVLASCADELADVPSLGDYTQWKRIDTWGKTPGHGDTYRIIYVNDVATTYAQMGYPDGTVLVKEVYDRDGDQPGALRIIEIMRRIGPDTDDDGGWVFTDAAEPNGTEYRKDFCWRRCHLASPFEGAWFDYSR